MAKSVTEALEETYSCTDCSNGVHDCILPSNGRRYYAEACKLGLLVDCGVVSLSDGDGCTVVPERYGTGYRLSLAGYEALTAFGPDTYPPDLRRFAKEPTKP
jgi:hypothetical protein